MVSITIFLLGRPGSGKSGAARHIDMLVRDKQWSSRHINDYTFLFEMFCMDNTKPEKERQFASTQLGGFNVIDFSVLNNALYQVQQKALIEQKSENAVVLLEFARGDYRTVFKQFDYNLLRNAYFFFIEVDVDICVTRVKERVRYPISQDDYFVSEEILRGYYSTENKSYIQKLFPQQYGIDPKRINVIDNTGNWREFGNNIKEFLNQIWINETGQPLTDFVSSSQPLVLPSNIDGTLQHNQVLSPLRVD